MAISEFDIADFETPSPARDMKLSDLRISCTTNGFFQIRNDGIPKDLQDGVLRMAQELYALPVAKKSELHLSRSSKNRGETESLRWTYW
jgi:isopenicillin N synthase-like dioxygenase